MEQILKDFVKTASTSAGVMVGTVPDGHGKVWEVYRLLIGPLAAFPPSVNQ